MAASKDGRHGRGADAIISAMAHAPRPVPRLGAKALTSNRLSNLIISTVPGPPLPLYLIGCKATRDYPIVRSTTDTASRSA
jgi:hypothetical protein